MANVVNISSLTKGSRLMRRGWRDPKGDPKCNKKCCLIPDETYTVTGKRKAPRGERVYLVDQYGSGCALVADKDGFLRLGWEIA